MSLAEKISKFNRQRKWQKFLEQCAPGADTQILDIGFSDEEYSAVDNFLEKNYSYPQNITAIGIDQPNKFLARYPKVKAIKYDGTHFPFSDQSFSIAWSNAVLEHVGKREAQINFLKEIKRVAKKAFITTPNRNFPLEVHTRIPFLHWLPKDSFDWILKRVGKGWAAGSYMNLLNLKGLKEILALAGIKDYKIIKNKLFGLTLDFIIVW